MWDKLSPRCTVCLNKFNTIEFSVYLAPPRRFICLLSPLSCGSVISGTCLRTKTVPDKTPAIGTHGGKGIRCSARTRGQQRLSGCVWALQTQSYSSPDWLTHWSVLSKEAASCLIDTEIYFWEAGLQCGEMDVKKCRDKTLKLPFLHWI